MIYLSWCYLYPLFRHKITTSISNAYKKHNRQQQYFRVQTSCLVFDSVSLILPRPSDFVTIFVYILVILVLKNVTEEEVASVRQLMENLDASVATLITAIEDMKPAYQHALRVLSTSGSNADGGPGNAQKNNLVFYGLPPEPLERQMEAEPEFCRDILETRIKTVFREHLKISRDIPFTHVYRSILIFGNCAFFALLCMNLLSQS